MSCCPETAWGKLQLDDYKPQGTLDTVGDLDLYRVGTGEKCIIWNYDIFGLNAGRTKMLADMFAECGYMVIIPDWFRDGAGCSPFDAGVFQFISSRTQWSKIYKDWSEKVLPYAKKHGAKRFGSVGTCWGSYVVLRLSAEPDFHAGVSFHPSHTKIATQLLKEDCTAMVKGIKCPQLMCPAQGDSEEDMEGKEHQTLVGAEMWEVQEFLEMQHGWITRGDLKDEKIKRDVQAGLEAGFAFFKKHL